MKYRDASCPEEYLEFVLNEWEKFNRANGGLCQAIKDLLEKYNDLKINKRKENNNEN